MPELNVLQLPVLGILPSICTKLDIYTFYYLLGTHWLWEMCQMLIKGKAEYSSKAKESTMMEFHLPEDYKDIHRPRVFNTHFTPMCLPKKMADKNCRIVIIQRNPKDVFTSLYHHYAVAGMVVDNSTTFSEYLDYILKNGELLLYGEIFL